VKVRVLYTKSKNIISGDRIFSRGIDSARVGLGLCLWFGATAHWLTAGTRMGCRRAMQQCHGSNSAGSLQHDISQAIRHPHHVTSYCKAN